MSKFKNLKTHIKTFLYGGILLVVFISGCETQSTESSKTQNSSTQPPQIKGVGVGCADEYCIWIKGSNFAPNSVVELRKSGETGQPIAKYAELDRTTEGSDQLITFAVKEQDAKAAMNTGVKVKVVNPDNNLSAESETIMRQSKK